jgi:hypothetical protein
MMTIDGEVFNSLADLAKESKRHPRTFLSPSPKSWPNRRRITWKKSDRLKDLT